MDSAASSLGSSVSPASSISCDLRMSGDDCEGWSGGRDVEVTCACGRERVELRVRSTGVKAVSCNVRLVGAGDDAREREVITGDCTD